MVHPAEVDRVDVHTAVVGPVVGEGDEKLGSDLGGGVDDLVKGREIDVGCSIGVPPLEHHLRGACALVSIVGQATGNPSAVLVVEAPGPEDAQAGVLGGGETLFDICLILELVSTASPT